MDIELFGGIQAQSANYVKSVAKKLDASWT